MVFNYFVPKGECKRYLSDGDYENDGYYGDDFEYEVDDSEVEDALISIIADDSDVIPQCLDYAMRIKIAQNIVSQISNINEDTIDDWIEYYEECLKDYFEEEAMEQYQYRYEY